MDKPTWTGLTCSCKGPCSSAICCISYWQENHMSHFLLFLLASWFTAIVFVKIPSGRKKREKRKKSNTILCEWNSIGYVSGLISNNIGTFFYLSQQKSKTSFLHMNGKPVWQKFRPYTNFSIRENVKITDMVCDLLKYY